MSLRFWWREGSGKGRLVRFSEELQLSGFYLLILLMLVVRCVTDYLSNRKRFPCINTRGVGRILHSYANPRRSRGFAQLSRIFPTPRVFISGYANTGKNVLYCFYKITFPRKKKPLLFRALIKEILTSREVLYTKLVRVISPCFADKMLSKIRVFLV